MNLEIFGALPWYLRLSIVLCEIYEAFRRIMSLDRVGRTAVVRYRTPI